MRLKYSCLQGSPKWNHVHLYRPGFTDSNQTDILISVKFKITLPSSLMEHSSSNQEVPGTCHSGSPPNRTLKCHKDKGLAISRRVREMKAHVTDARRPGRPGQSSTVSGGGGGGGESGPEGARLPPPPPLHTWDTSLPLRWAPWKLRLLETSGGALSPAGHPDPSSRRGSPPPGHTSRDGSGLTKTQAVSEPVSLCPVPATQHTVGLSAPMRVPGRTKGSVFMSESQ